MPTHRRHRCRRRRKARYRPGGLLLGRTGFAPAGRRTEFRITACTYSFGPALPGRTVPRLRADPLLPDHDRGQTSNEDPVGDVTLVNPSTSTTATVSVWSSQVTGQPVIDTAVGEYPAFPTEQRVAEGVHDCPDRQLLRHERPHVVPGDVRRPDDWRLQPGGYPRGGLGRHLPPGLTHGPRVQHERTKGPSSPISGRSVAFAPPPCGSSLASTPYPPCSRWADIRHLPRVSTDDEAPTVRVGSALRLRED